jgi:FAD/FMN-containing dehydrogenase
MTAIQSIAPSRVAALRDAVRGHVVTPDDGGYEQARRVWNGAIDRYPALVVRCAGVPDVVAAVRFARENDLLLAIRGGGHNVAGTGTCDGGLVIDLSPMKGIRVDPASGVIRAEPGLLWRELDAGTQEHGLAVTGGIVSSTGIAGFTLGGGIGWLHRRHGLTIDSLLAADVVTADGNLVRASEEENPDLLWGLRGGGGNFGIVTEFEYQGHPVGPELMAGLVFYRADDLVQVVCGYRDLMAAAPDALALFLVLRRAPAVPFLAAEMHGQPVVAIVGCYAGPLEDGARALEPLAKFAPPVANLMQPRAYTQFQSMLDASWAEGFGNYWKAEYVTGIPDLALDVLAEALHDITSPLSDFKLAALGGAAGRVPADATAFAYRHAPFVLNINARWPLTDDPQPHIEWTRRLWETMRPFTAGGGYVNFLGDEGAARVRDAYGEPTYRRLVALKDAYDPDNTFRVNQNVAPTTGRQAVRSSRSCPDPR